MALVVVVVVVLVCVCVCGEGVGGESQVCEEGDDFLVRGCMSWCDTPCQGLWLHGISETSGPVPQLISDFFLQLAPMYCLCGGKGWPMILSEGFAYPGTALPLWRWYKHDLPAGRCPSTVSPDTLATGRK